MGWKERQQAWDCGAGDEGGGGLLGYGCVRKAVLFCLLRNG